MDFARVIRSLSECLAARGERFVVIGGVALAACGMPRLTLDLDLAVAASAQDGLVAWLEASGYQTLHRSTGYSNHLHADPERGRVDVVYLRGETARRIFAAARTVPGPGDTSIAIPCPEHLAALKAFAIRNDRSRRLQELADISFLLTLPGVDRAEIEDSFRRYGLEDELVELA